MTKRFITSVAIVAMLAIAVAPASANEAVRGNTLAIALTGLPDDLYSGESLSMRIRVLIYEDGTTNRHPITITTWVDTPFGRAILASETLRLLPGRIVTTSASFNYVSPFPAGSRDPILSTVGVTVTYKTETLEARHSMLLHSGPAPQ